MERPIANLLVTAILGTVLLACSKDPNAPDANTPITGTWVSTDTVAVFTRMNLNVVQTADGKLTGSWTGTAKATNGKCPPDVTCAPANILYGSNLSLLVSIEVLGAGEFVGQLKTKNELQGSFISFNLENPEFHFHRQ